MESPVENFMTGKMIQSIANNINHHGEEENDRRHLRSAHGFGVASETDAQRGVEVLAQRDQFMLKRESRLNCGPNLEFQSENVFKMHPVNVKKFLLLNIVTAAEKSSSNLKRQAWYHFDLSKVACEGDNWVVGQMDLKVWKIPQMISYPSICFSLESKIYMICGHSYRGTKYVRMYYLDTSNPENEWLEGASISVCANVGSVAVHEGKIYVFGRLGEYVEDNRCSCKEYDQLYNSWEPLSCPPTQLGDLQGKFLGSYGDRKILVHPCGRDMLYAYDVMDDSWEVLDRHFGFWNCHGVIMDDVLYVFDDERVEIGGYDLVRLKWLKAINLDDLEWFSRTKNSEGTEMHEAFFFKVKEDVLGLVYFDRMGREGLDIYCKTFSIRKIMQEDGDVRLEAEVYSSTIYNLGEAGHCINYVVV